MIHDLSASLRKILEAPKEAKDMAVLYENSEPLRLPLGDFKTALENFVPDLVALDPGAPQETQGSQSSRLLSIIDVLRSGGKPPTDPTKIDKFEKTCTELEPLFSAPDAEPPDRRERVLSFAAFIVSFWELRKATISLQRLSDIKPETDNTVSLFLYDIKENMQLRN
ncbi:MAG TPA: hypothetical protein VFA15_08375, partial [Nitrososphaera sp.]|nr:hypothetical protein [Nitrososphaera sp.]